VTPSGIMTSHITSAPLVRAGSGYTDTGFSTQSELRPSACMVDEPSKPHSGSWSSVGNVSNSLICVLPRRFGVGVYPSSQMYSSLYLVILPLSMVMRGSRNPLTRPPDHPAWSGSPKAAVNKAFNVPNRTRSGGRSTGAFSRPARGPSRRNRQAHRSFLMLPQDQAQTAAQKSSAQNMPDKGARGAVAHNVRICCFLQCILQTGRAAADTITM
jgi:hypothetical protein